MPNRNRAQTLASFMLPDRSSLSKAVRAHDPEHQQQRQYNNRHTHSRSLSRHRRQPGFASPIDDDAFLIAQHADEATAADLSSPHLLENFTMEIHPGLRWGSKSPPLGDISENHPPSAASPHAGTSLRRTKSSAGRPERSADPEPPLPTSGGMGSATGGAHTARRPSTSTSTSPLAPKVATSTASTHAQPPRSDLPLYDGIAAPPPTNVDPFEGTELVSITYAVEMAVRPRVRSVPKSPADGTLDIAPIDKRRRSTSLGGDQAFLPARPTTRLIPRATPLTTSARLSASCASPPSSHTMVAMKTEPTAFPAPMPFAIPSRAAPPPPIVVPPAATKRLRSPPPPRQTSPPLPPRTLPKLPPPSRSLPPLPPSSQPAIVPATAPLATAGLSPSLPPIPSLLPVSLMMDNTAIISAPIVLPVSPSAIPVPLTSVPTSPILSPVSPLRSPALGPDSAYARYRARARAKTLASSFPTCHEQPRAAAATANGEETLADTIMAIHEAEEWEWPLPPVVRRPSRRPSANVSVDSHAPSSSDLGHGPADVRLPGLGADKVEELRSLKSRVPHEPIFTEDYASIHPFAAARHAIEAHHLTIRRGSDSSIGPQNSGSSLASDHGPLTPDDFDNPFDAPQSHHRPSVGYALGHGAHVVKPGLMLPFSQVPVPAHERPRRFGVPF